MHPSALKIDVAPVIALAPAPTGPEAGATAWWTLPYGPARGEAFAAAREAPGACYGCAGRRWWCSEGEADAARCWTCHPPPPGMAVREVTA